MEETGLSPTQLQRLLEVGRGLVSELRPDAVLRQVLETARDLTGARYAAIGVLDPAGGALERFVFIGIEDELRQRIGDLPRGHGILGELIRDPRPLRLTQLSHHPRSYGFPAEHPPMESFLGVPVVIRGRIFGNLYLTEKRGGEEFDERDEQLVVVLAEWAAVAIDNARSHEVEARRTVELERVMRGMRATVSLNRELTGETDLERILELVAKRGRALVEASSCVVLLLGASGSSLQVAAWAGEPAPDERIDVPATPATAVRAALGSRENTPLDATAIGQLGLEGRSALMAPLRMRGRPLGALVAIDRLRNGPGFDDDDDLALSAFAVSAATAIGATQQADAEKRRLSIASSERERARWAREIHDETLQELSALRVMQESALHLDDPETMRRALKHASEQTEHLISGLQGLITELRPAALDQLGVAAAIEALVNRVGDRAELTIEVDVDLPADDGGSEHRLDAELEATIYRIVQESLSNVAKHAGAGRARVMVEARDGRVGITVEDDGHGLQPGDPSPGFGLIGLRERAELVGGSINVTPGVKGGVRVTADLPLLARR